MYNKRTFYNPGKLLEVLENGLTFLSIRLETAVEKKLGRYYKNDRITTAVKKREAQRKEQNKLRAKSENISVEQESEKRVIISAKENRNAEERLQELDTTQESVSHDAQLDRD